jgi:short-subunit dehydrogenase
MLWAAGFISAGYLLHGFIKRTLRSFDYKNKVVLITGGSRGLGLVLAREVASRGAHLVLLARDNDELKTAKAQIQSTYPECEVQTVPCDLKDKAQVTWALKQVFIHFGSLDMVINNAGVISVMPYENASEDDFKDAMDTHFWGPFHMIEAVLPHFKTNKGGRIVNISSIGGKVAVPHLAPYCASKFALVGYSESLSAELAKDNIYVTTVCPGLMRTGSIGHAQFKGQESWEYSWFAIASSLPLLSIEAEKAAQQICDAAKIGRAELIISLPAKLLVKMRSLMPELTSDLTSLADRVLPDPVAKPRGAKAKLGMNTSTPVVPSFLTKPAEKAAQKNNEGQI